MQPLPTYQCRQAAQALALKSAISDLAECANCPDASDIAAEVTTCTGLDALIDIFNREMVAAVCCLQGAGVSCDRPWDCDNLIINTDSVFDGQLFVYDPFAKGFSIPSVTELAGLCFAMSFGAESVMSFLTQISIPLLEDITQTGIYCRLQERMTDFSAPNLKNITGNITISDNRNLVDFDSNNWEVVHGDIRLQANQIQHFTIDNLTSFTGTTFTVGGCQLPVADVNSILIKLDYLGTSNCVIYMANDPFVPSAANNARPTGAGLTAVTNLQGRGCTVTINAS